MSPRECQASGRHRYEVVVGETTTHTTEPMTSTPTQLAAWMRVQYPGKRIRVVALCCLQTAELGGPVVTSKRGTRKRKGKA